MTREEHRQFEGYGDESGQCNVGLAADNHRPVETQHINLQPQRERQAAQAEKEGGNGQARAFDTEGIVDAVHGVRREYVVDFYTRGAHVFNGVQQHIFVFEDTKGKVLSHACYSLQEPKRVSREWQVEERGQRARLS